MPNPNVTPEILAAAVQGLEAQRARLDDQIAEVRRMLRTHIRPQKPAAQAEAPKRKQRMSATALRHIVEAQKKRWAEYHRKQAAAAQKAEEPTVATKPPGPKRKLSAAGRRHIVEATRKRWAEFHRQKAAEANQPAAPVKKVTPKQPVKKAAVEGKKKAVVKAAQQAVAMESASE